MDTYVKLVMSFPKEWKASLVCFYLQTMVIAVEQRLLVPKLTVILHQAKRVHSAPKGGFCMEKVIGFIK